MNTTICTKITQFKFKLKPYPIWRALHPLFVNEKEKLKAIFYIPPNLPYFIQNDLLQIMKKSSKAYKDTDNS